MFGHSFISNNEHSKRTNNNILHILYDILYDYLKSWWSEKLLLYHHHQD